MKNRQLYRHALKLAVPMMIQNGITNMVSLVDNVMVGSLGTEAITAVSIVGQLMFVFNLAVFGGFSGPGIFGAQFYGQKNEEGFKSSVRMKLWIGLVCLALGLTLFAAANKPLIELYMRGESGSVDPGLTLDLAKQYLFIMMLGMPPFVLTQVYATSLRETGESITPMVSGVVSVVVDIVFNYLLIYGTFGFPKLGVAGAAIATVMARYVEFLIIYVFMLVKREKHTYFRGIFKTMLVKKETAANILRKSIPMFLNEFLWAGSIAVMTQCYSIRGLELVAGLNISNSLCNMFNVVFIALGSAIGILVGQMLGAEKYEDAKRNAFRLMRFSASLCVGLTVILVIFSGIFPKFYDTTDGIRKFAQYFIIITALFFPVQGCLNAIYFTIRSGGKTFITFMFDGFYSIAVSVPLAAMLCNLTDISIFAVYTIVQAVDMIKVVIGHILIKRGKWINNLTGEITAKA